MTDITNSSNTFSGKTAVALGIFDGVHKGHREIISAALKYKSRNLSPAVFTFNVESVVSKHGRSYEFIYSEAQKKEILQSLGIEYIYSPEEGLLRSMSGEDFAREILAGKLSAKAVICGENFRFGRGAACGAEQLLEFGIKYGFEVEVVKLLENDKGVISSESVRQLLREGKVSGLDRILGEGYFIDSIVVVGNRLGRTLDFPTINQNFLKGQLVPRKGVYSSFAVVDAKVYRAVTNIGSKPTVEKKIKPLAETHILDYSGDLYGRKIKVTLDGFIRDEMKFSSLEELKKQIGADIALVKSKA